MTLDDKNMDQLFRETLGTYKAKPSKGLWPRIVGGLGGSTFVWKGTSGWKGGIYSALIVGVLGTAAYFMLNSEPELQENKNLIAVDSQYVESESEPLLEVVDQKSEEIHVIESVSKPESPTQTNETIVFTETVTEDASVEPEISTQFGLSNDQYDEEEAVRVLNEQDKTYNITEVEKESEQQILLLTETNNVSQQMEMKDQVGIETKRKEYRMSLKFPDLDFGERKIKKRNYQYQKRSKFKMLGHAFKAGQYTASVKYTPELIYVPGKSPDFNQGVDLDLGLLYNGLSFHTGIGLIRSIEVSEYAIRYISKDSVGAYNHILSYDYNPETGQIIYNSVEETLYDSTEKNDHQVQDRKYYFIRIPVLFGSDLWTYKRFNLRAKVGAMFQIKVLEDKPDFTTPEQSVAILEVKQEQNIPSKSNIYVVGALQMEYLIHNRVSLTLEPTFRYYIKQPYESFYQGGIPYSLGARAGFIIYL